MCGVTASVGVYVYIQCGVTAMCVCDRTTNVRRCRRDCKCKCVMTPCVHKYLVFTVVGVKVVTES